MVNQEGMPKFDARIYIRIALNDLVTYAVYYLAQSKVEIAAEDIVAACFLLFPKRFALRGYDQWPDSTVVNKRWVDCRKKGLVSGSTALGFSLTPKGLQLAERVERTLKGQRPLIQRPGASKVRAEKRTRAGRFVRSLEESEAYKLFQQDGERAIISEFDFRSMLLCTMDSSPATLSNNLEEFKQHANLYERKDLIHFLDYCAETFAALLRKTVRGEEQHRGGMLPQKRSHFGGSQ